MHESHSEWDDQSTKYALGAAVAWAVVALGGWHNEMAFAGGACITALTINLYRHKGYGRAIIGAAILASVAMLFVTAQMSLFVLTYPTGTSGEYSCGSVSANLGGEKQIRWSIDELDYPAGAELAERCSEALADMKQGAMTFAVPTGLVLAVAVRGKRRRASSANLSKAAG